MYLGLRRSKQTEIIICFKTRSMDDSIASFSNMNDSRINN